MKSGGGKGKDNGKSEEKQRMVLTPKDLVVTDPSIPVSYLNQQTGRSESKIVIRESKELIMNILPGDHEARFVTKQVDTYIYKSSYTSTH